MTMRNNMGQFGDTTLTKVFVGGLAWETPKEALRDHFGKYGEIVEAVIISDEITGRSKGYGFVTFQDSEAAKKACEDATPIINGRRANCNLASLGGRRPRSASIMPLPQQETKICIVSTTGQTHHAVVLSSEDICIDVSSSAPSGRSFLWKLSYTGGSYMNGHFLQVYTGQTVVGANTSIPMYPLYNFHQSQTMGSPTAHIYSPTTVGPMTTVPALISKPILMGPKTGVQLVLVKLSKRENSKRRVVMGCCSENIVI
ncbi:unnamed protein product [Camellia sinensis]